MTKNDTHSSDLRSKRDTIAGVLTCIRYYPILGSMSLTFALDQFLTQHGLTAYRLEKETSGDVARNSVYAMARGDVQRLDLKNVNHILAALGALLGRPVGIQELFVGDVAPAQLRSTAAGVPYTGDQETDEVLDTVPDILERRARRGDRIKVDL